MESLTKGLQYLTSSELIIVHKSYLLSH